MISRILFVAMLLFATANHAVTPATAQSVPKSSELRAVDARAAMRLFKKALKLYKAQDLEGASEAFKLGLIIDPKNAVAHYYVAKTLQGLGRHEEAMAHFRRSAEFGPDTTEGVIAGAILKREATDPARLLHRTQLQELTSTNQCGLIVRKGETAKEFSQLGGRNICKEISGQCISPALDLANRFGVLIDWSDSSSWEQASAGYLARECSAILINTKSNLQFGKQQLGRGDTFLGFNEAFDSRAKCDGQGTVAGQIRTCTKKINTGSSEPDSILGTHYYFRGRAHERNRNWQAANTDYLKSVDVLRAARPKPGEYRVFWEMSMSSSLNAAAWLLATCPDDIICGGFSALMLATESVRLTPSPQIMDTLAAAYAQTGSFDEAVFHQEAAIAKLRKLNVVPDLTEYLERLELYQQHKPYRHD